MANIDIFGLIRKVISNITVEPFILAWFLPSCLLIVAMENLNLEKACRVNLAQSDEVCINMINKAINNINCAEIDLIDESDLNMTDNSIYNLTRRVCNIETESQKLLSVAIGFRSMISSIFPLIIVLFAGSWSDKKGIRKPLVLLPIVGELISSVVLLVSSIFMNEIPLEIPAYAERVVPSFFGGETLMLLGVYSYLTQMTTEENRTFRFGCLTVFLTLIPVLSIPFSGKLFNFLGYIKLFTLCVIIYVLGILYILFILQEVKVVENNQASNGVENPAFANDNEKISSIEAAVNASKTKNELNQDKTTAELTKKGFLREFFDPTTILEIIDVIAKKRDGNKRIIIWFVIACNIAFLATLSETQYTYLYTRLKLNWDGDNFSFHLAFGTAVASLGTLLMVGVFSKFFKISDPMIGIISTVFTLLAKPIYIVATTTSMFYFGTIIDLFVSTKAIAIKSIISKIVGSDELGKIFSVLGILESGVGFFFPILYSMLYRDTVKVFIGAIYLLSEFFFMLTLIIFIIIYIMLRKTTERKDECADNYKGNPDLYESTKL